MNGAVLWIGLALAQASPPVTKLVCFLEPVSGSDEFEVRIENPSPGALDALVDVELVLEPRAGQRQGDPLEPALTYRAVLDLSGEKAAPGSGASRLRIPPKASKRWRVRATDPPWHEKVSAVRAGAGGFKSVVRPGPYRLDLLLRQSDSVWSTSRGIDVTVSAGGALSVR